MIESEIDRGVFVSRAEAESTTFAEALDRYDPEIAASKKGYVQEASLLRNLEEHGHCVQTNGFGAKRGHRQTEGRLVETDQSSPEASQRGVGRPRS
ncbi:hypothetical protein [Mycetohabitans sp. B8]|uniref:hypothetical protein n=1 Tax=Mycetohabitans sp. B8 TaxID=2841845 RepID=UPI001F390AD6|nr:hypothetical protein [Mycetohabitans sp. B8]